MSRVTVKNGCVEIYYDENSFADNDHEFEWTVTTDKEDAYGYIVDAVIDEQKMTLAEAKAYIKGLTDCGYDIYTGYEDALLDAYYEDAKDEYESYCEVHEDEWKDEYESERSSMLKDYYDGCL